MNIWIQFEGVRCFPTMQRAALRPITLLIGENSSGKSTFLALCHVAASLVKGPTRELPFNDPPFLLGAYDQIASYRRGSSGRAKSFSIGISLSHDHEEGAVNAEFGSRAGQPYIRKWSLRKGDLHFEVSFGDALIESVVVATERGRRVLSSAEANQFEPLFVLEHLPAAFLSRLLLFTEGGLMPSHAEVEELVKALQSLRDSFGRGTYALAPMRSGPQRTYDPISAESKPEGSHVPMLLASLRPSEREALWTAMKKFGHGSGLFEGIEVIRKGKKQSDPFQIGVKTGGPSVNLVDVGYGVSQVLPIVVDALQRSGSNETLLLQQPEVHLHPRAQAELGSFFARLARKTGRFIIETHSDYLVDRVRQEVRDGTLKPDDVSLLYFNRGSHGATVHGVDLDKDGTILNPPEGYRQFFLDEERSLLGV